MRLDLFAHRQLDAFERSHRFGIAFIIQNLSNRFEVGEEVFVFGRGSSLCWR